MIDIKCICKDLPFRSNENTGTNSWYPIGSILTRDVYLQGYGRSIGSHFSDPRTVLDFFIEYK